MLKTSLAVIALTAAAFAFQTKPTTTQKPAAKTPAKPAAKTAAPVPAYPEGFPENPKDPVAIIQTSAGPLTCELFQDKAPITVANFIGLAEGTKAWKNPLNGQPKKGVPLYNGTIFHRVIPEFMIQGGDPLGTGEGGPGYSFNDEFSPDLSFKTPGTMGMANSGSNTNGSQFFIGEKDISFLDPCLDAAGCMRGRRMVPKGYGYNIFGRCTPDSVELVKKIARMPRGAQDRPEDPVKIVKVTIRKPAGAAPAKKPTPHKTGTSSTHKSPATKTPAGSVPK
jgi:peptidyl-prolyl cis-trans isomerase A (cyclophilin A)